MFLENSTTLNNRTPNLLQLTPHLKEVPKPLWNEDFSGNPEKS
jgi:hypothetical protein